MRACSSSACIAIVALLQGCGGGASAVAPKASPSPSTSLAPVVTTRAAATALPVQGALVAFPTAAGATGVFKMPSYTAAADTTIALSTTYGNALPAAQARKRQAGASRPTTLMSLGLTVSADVTLNALPITAFTLPPSISPASALTLEVFDDATSTLIIAEPRGSAGNLIAFSEYLPDGSAQNVPLDLKAGRPYSFALVTNSGLTLPAAGAPCGLPPPLPIVPFDLAYPEPSATGVPVSAGELVFQGAPDTYFGPRTVSVTSAATTVVDNVAVPESPAPSPLPTPYATPQGSYAPFEAVALPTLSPQTLYTVTSTSFDFSETPPACTAPATQTLGSFTTL